VWTDLGFRGNLYEIDPVPPTEEGERLLVGRAGELEQLQMYLTSSATHPTIEGQNGVGKSSLVAVAGFQLKRAFQRERTTQLLIPLRERFQLDSAATADAFGRRVYFAVAQAFIDDHDLLKKTGQKVPDVDHIREWLNSPIFVGRQGGGQVLGSGLTYGQGSAANEGAGFSDAGFRATVERWLSDMFPSDEAGGFICVLDNLELLLTVQGARGLLESLRDSLLSRPGLRWVLCGARGIMRGAASSSRLPGVLSDPMELQPIPDEVVPDVIARRIEVFQQRLDAYAPVEPDGFQHLFEVGNRNLRNALKYCEDFTFWQQREKTFPTAPEDKRGLLEPWMAYQSDEYLKATAGVGNRAWEVFEHIVEMGGLASPSDYSELGFETPQAFRGQVKPLEDAQLVESSVDEGDKRRRSIEITGRGWIVRYRRSGYKLPT
jgi:hypothetical protein